MSDDASEERWLPVVGYEGIYEVSDRGRVWSLRRTIYYRTGARRRVGGRFLSAKLVTGYGAVTLCGVGPQTARLVHVLVLEAFVGPRPEGCEACHFDGDRQNAKLSNLRWDTSSANNYDIVRCGTHAGANKTHCNYGHLLAEPNLIRRQGTFQQRACLACSRGRSIVTYYAKTGRPYYSMQEMSDRYYSAIMGEAA